MITINYPPLTSEQIERIYNYRFKWKQIALNQEPINREQAKLAVNKAYNFLNKSQPKILFFNTPYDALVHINLEASNNWGKLHDSALGIPLSDDLLNELLGDIRSQIQGKILDELQGNLDENLAYSIAVQTESKLGFNKSFAIIWANFSAMAFAAAQNSNTKAPGFAIFQLLTKAVFVLNRYFLSPLSQTKKELARLFFKTKPPKNKKNSIFSTLFSNTAKQNNDAKYQLPIVRGNSGFANLIVPSTMTDYAYYIDYCHEVLNCDRDPLKWSIFSELITTCGWIFPYEKIVLICDRTRG